MAPDENGVEPALEERLQQDERGRGKTIIAYALRSGRREDEG